MKLKPKTSGPDVGLTLRLTPLVPDAPPCESSIEGLYWFSDASGAFDATAEAAYLLPEGGAGPTLAVAKLLGETCDGEVTWTTSWMPQAIDGGAPGIWSDGPDMIVYPLETMTPGILSVSAELDGVTYGPIVLVVVRYECYCYYSAPTSAPTLAWRDFHTVFDASDVSGLTWTANPKAMDVAPTYGNFTATLSIKPGYSFPGSFSIRIGFTTNDPDFWDASISINGNQEFSIQQGDTMPVECTLFAAMTSISGYFPHDWPAGELTLEIECLGPP